MPQTVCRSPLQQNQGGFASMGKLLGLLGLAGLMAAVSTLSVQSDVPKVTHDGLHLEEASEVAYLWVKPDADFSVYNRFVMLEAYVAFKKNWQRDTKVAGRRVSNKEMEKIKVGVGEVLYEAFREELDEEGGYTFVDGADDDVMIIRPAIIDLDITAPDVPRAGRSEQYVARSGAATLYLELFDSVSGEILLRTVDRKRTMDYGYMRWANSVTNRADAMRMFKRWASLLREGMDEVKAT